MDYLQAMENLIAMRKMCDYERGRADAYAEMCDTLIKAMLRTTVEEEEKNVQTTDQP